VKLAILVGTLAELAGVGLTATATWLIMRAAEHPPMQALTVAVVAVRTLALAKGALRYLERLTSHKAVLSEAVELRGRVYDDLVNRRHIPSGTALTRIVTNVDQHLDTKLRATLPWITAALVSAVIAVVSGFSRQADRADHRTRPQQGRADRLRLVRREARRGHEDREDVVTQGTHSGSDATRDRRPVRRGTSHAHPERAGLADHGCHRDVRDHHPARRPDHTHAGTD
jgi:hypothetical protein